VPGKVADRRYLSLAATLTTRAVSDRISQGEPAPSCTPHLHGQSAGLRGGAGQHRSPARFAVARAGRRIERQLKHELEACAGLPSVEEVRVLGAIGVIELKQPVNMATVQPAFVERGVWLRPFGRLIYTMPPYVIEESDLRRESPGHVRCGIRDR